MLLSLDHIGKTYADRRVLQNVSMNLREGAVLGILGPNGAGKSTLLKIIATLLKPTAGKLLWEQKDVHSVLGPFRELLGYLPQDFGVYPNLTPLEFLQYFAALKQIKYSTSKKRIPRLLDELGLRDVAYEPLRILSGGMKQRVGIAQALLNDPKVLIIDEPTTGLDPFERMRLRNQLAEHSSARILLLSTHHVSDLTGLATEILIINQGSVVATGAPETVAGIVRGKIWEFTSTTSFSENSQEMVVVSRVSRSGGFSIRALAELPPVPSAVAVQPTLEDAYLWSTAYPPEVPV